jgi:hypothetical protein
LAKTLSAGDAIGSIALISVLGWKRIVSKLWHMPLPELGAKVYHRAVWHLWNQWDRLAWHLWKNSALESKARAALWGDPGATLHEQLGRRRGMALSSLFLACELRRERWLSWIKTDGEKCTKLLSSADRICRHEFDLLGSGPVKFGESIPWHKDFKSGHTWPTRFHKTLWVYNPWDHSDVKVPWELSRFQHLPLLGKAWWLSGDERYSEEAASEMRDWIRKNPTGFGVNWKCPMDVAIRAVNWIHAWAMFSDSSAFSDEDWKNLLTALYRHGQFVRSNLEYHVAVRGNHYLSNLAGLAFLGCVFADTPEGREWRKFAREQLKVEMEFQVLPDGVNQEMSTSYHRLVLELFLWSAGVLAAGDGDAAPYWRVEKQFGAPFMHRLRGMFEYAAAHARPDSKVPLFGDHDDGRLHLLGSYADWTKDSTRHLLALGACLFDEPAWWAASDDDGREEAYWMFGEECVSDIKRRAANLPPCAAKSRAFTESGFYVMRHAAHFAMLRCGPVGMRGAGGHDHCDHLSMEIAIDGLPLVVDPGCYVYTADPKARSLFRSTAFHNTLQVDGQEQNGFDSYNLFGMKERTFSKCRLWTSDSEHDEFEGEHQGFDFLEKGLVHRRRVVFDKRNGRVLVTDFCPAQRRHSYVWHWHLPPEAKVLSCERVEECRGSAIFRERVLLESAEKRFIVLSSVPNLARKSGWISRSYGKRSPADILSWQIEQTGPMRADFAFSGHPEVN